MYAYWTVCVVLLNVTLVCFGCRNASSKETLLLTVDVFFGKHVEARIEQDGDPVSAISCRHYGDACYIVAHGAATAIATNYYPARFVISTTSDWVRVLLFPVFQRTNIYSADIILREAACRNINGMPMYRDVLKRDELRGNFATQMSEADYAIFRTMLALSLAQFQLAEADEMLADYYYDCVITTNRTMPHEQVVVALGKLLNITVSTQETAKIIKKSFAQVKSIEYVNVNRCIATAHVMLDGYPINRHDVVFESRLVGGERVWIPVADEVSRH